MKTFSIVALPALLSTLVQAVPMAKRDLVVVTRTHLDYVTVAVTETVWVGAGGHTAVAQTPHRHSHSRHTVHVTSTVHVSSPSAYSSSAVAESTSSAASVAHTTSTSAYVASSASSTSAYVASTPSSTSVYVAPSSTSTSAYVAPSSSSTSVYVASSTTSSAPAATSSAASGGTYTGDLTYYSTGLGSCGQTSTDSDAIVALAHGMMEAAMAAAGVVNPNDNPLCNQKVSITYTTSEGVAVTKQATIVDTCEGCVGASLDLSPSLFDCFAAESVGRLTGATWSYV